MTLSFSNDANGNAPISYIAITLTNNQAGATGTNFPCLVTVNSNTNTDAYQSALLNVCFQDGAGNLLKSWLESGELKTSTASRYWVLIPSSIAGSGGTLVIYQVLTGTALTSMDAVYAGAEPLYNGTYGQYDNGTGVFSFYENFAGNSLPATFIKGTGTKGTLSFSNGMSLTNAGSTATCAQSKNTQLGASGVAEVYATASGFGNLNNLGLGVSDTDQNATMQGYFNFFNLASGVYYSTTYYREGAGYVAHLTKWTAAGGACIMGIARTATTVIPMVNYTAGSAGTATWGASTALYFIMNRVWLEGTTDAGTILYQWTRVRAYPPSNVMPSATFGALTAIPASLVPYTNPIFQLLAH